jgi:hypothetical protein
VPPPRREVSFKLLLNSAKNISLLGYKSIERKDFMDNESENEELSIEREFVPPLSERQVKQCKDPWGSLTYEEEFYILYDAIAEIARTEKRNNDPILRAMKLANWFPRVTGSLPAVPPGALVQKEEDLNPRKLAWGRAVRAAISKDHLLVHILALRFDDLSAGACIDAEWTTEAEVNFFQTPPHLLPYHV